MQRLNFQRGLQGELERTIESFPAVEHARVHIVLPARTLFISEEDSPTGVPLLVVSYEVSGSVLVFEVRKND